MRTLPMPPTRRSTQSDWVVVSECEGIHTEHRSPQHNTDNLSSNEVANASADGASSAMSILVLSEADIHAINDAALDVEVPYDPAHIPPSNGESSTDTAGTDDTLIGLNLAGTPHTVAPTPYTPATASATHQQLTPNNINSLQRELAQFWPTNLPRWVDGAGMGDRLVVANMSYDSAAGHSTMASGTGSRRSGCSSVVAAAGLDWLVVAPPAAGDEVLAATGAWCFDMSAAGTGGRRYSIVSVDE